MNDDELDRAHANRGSGFTARELGTQVAMGGIATAAIGLIIVLLIVAGFVIAGVLSIVASVVIVAVLRGPFIGPTGYLKACLVGEVAWPAVLVGIFGTAVALVYLVS
jgi:hypothetical protein